MNPIASKKCKVPKRRKPISQLDRQRRSRLLFQIRKVYQRDSNEQLRNIEQFTPSLDTVYKDIHTNKVESYDVNLRSEQSISDTSVMYVENEENFEVNLSTVDDNIVDGVFMDSVNEAFQKSLASAFIKCNLTQTQGNIILNTLRSHECHSFLPKDTRSLLNTPRESIPVRTMYPGQYLHIGFEVAINNILKEIPPNQIPLVLEIDWNTDGASLNKTGKKQIWPIQISVNNIPNSKPQVVGIYIGNKKPDAPARAWLLNHYGHTSRHACGKCWVVGIRYEQRMIFLGTNHRLRTNEEYVRMTDYDHHKGISPLSRLPMGMVTQVPVEYMHLVCIGIVKKLLNAWVTGKYGKKTKLSGRNLELTSKRLQLLSHYCPRDFARKPRSLSDFSEYKATEGRQFILYTGPVVMHGILEKQAYIHFLFLHSAIRALCSKSPSRTLLLRRAEVAIKKFVEKCQVFYKLSFLSYNVHALLHLVKDVEHFREPLDNFSAFKYENNMPFFRQFYRKPHLASQQFALRQAEINIRKELRPTHIVTFTKIFDRHSEGPLPVGMSPRHCQQYTKIQTENMFFNVTSLGNNCCVLKGCTICVIENILEINETYHFVVKKFAIMEDLYDVGISSSLLGIYKCSALSNDLCTIPITDVQSKCYIMPYWKVIDDNGSDSSTDLDADQPVADEYVVSVLL
ncbi:uncharacterized protein [Linepithema humile]|uniref:uncharacterized protein n=1 Tax=Linepithema humile TaxID=83485 RepID=UPI00351E945F